MPTRQRVGHPCTAANGGWVAAGDLRPGEPIITLSGGTSTVVWLRVVPGQADRYNLTVAQDHTYAVGAGQWVVHNIGCQDALTVRQGATKPNGNEPGAGAIIEQQGAVPLTGHAGERGVPNPGLDLRYHPHNGGCAEVVCASKAIRSIEMGTGGWQKGKPITIYISQINEQSPCIGCDDVLYQLASYVEAPVTAVWQDEAFGETTFTYPPGFIPFGGNP